MAEMLLRLLKKMLESFYGSKLSIAVSDLFSYDWYNSLNLHRRIEYSIVKDL